MKRRDLERKLRRAGCYLKREGASHTLWTNPQSGTIEAVPRHTEIKEHLAKKIIKSLGAEV
ncbi:type II toxin-antitoxin system HicA family toxin [Verrucomicrobia bacterium]|nr:type II toxin-antitoxin system HicA family toxin [Verrucomicrobiota bacterium]